MAVSAHLFNSHSGRILGRRRLSRLHPPRPRSASFKHSISDSAIAWHGLDVARHNTGATLQLSPYDAHYYGVNCAGQRLDSYRDEPNEWRLRPRRVVLSIHLDSAKRFLS